MSSIFGNSPKSKVWVNKSTRKEPEPLSDEEKLMFSIVSEVSDNESMDVVEDIYRTVTMERNPTNEAMFQICAYSWLKEFREFYSLVFLIDHTHNQSNSVSGTIARDSGTLKGKPDFVLWTNKGTLFIELKTESKHSRLDKEQKRIHQILRDMRYRVEVVRTYSSFKQLIYAHFGINN